MTARELTRALEKKRNEFENFILDILSKSKLVKIEKKEEIVKVERPELVPFLKVEDKNYSTEDLISLLSKETLEENQIAKTQEEWDKEKTEAIDVAVAEFEKASKEAKIVQDEKDKKDLADAEAKAKKFIEDSLAQADKKIKEMQAKIDKLSVKKDK